MRLVHVYRRGDVLYVQASSKTTTGLWVASGEVDVVPVTLSDVELGTIVARRFEHSLRGVPHPTDWKAVVAPLLKHSRTRTFNAFARGVELVTLTDHDDGTVTLAPTENRGTKHGFVEIPSAAVRLDRPTPERLGEHLRESFKRCPAGSASP